MATEEGGGGAVSYLFLSMSHVVEKKEKQWRMAIENWSHEGVTSTPSHEG